MKGFGADRKVLEINGRLGAIIQAPLTWNFENYRKFKQLPDASRKGIAAVACVNPPPFENNHEWLAAKWGRIARIGTTTDELGGWFKMVYDEKNLYVLLSTRIPMGRVYPSKGRNYGACGTDSVELFIDAEGTGQRYYHFLINPVENSFMDGAFGLRELDTLQKFIGVESFHIGAFDGDNGAKVQEFAQMFTVGVGGFTCAG